MGVVNQPSVDTRTGVDTGTGYGLPKPVFDSKLISVGPGTPMGETLRRYWHPIALSTQACDVPRKVRLLSEDLILFRDGQGRPGLVAETCCHRGASLFYGRIEDDGIRCCYHGWKFDAQGHCVEQPFEPNGGAHRDAARQPWYPVQERYGLVWAYMGPPAKKPILPRWQSLEIPEGSTDILEVSLNPGWADDNGMAFHWLHCYENAMDPFHVPWLHFMHSGPQFIFDGLEAPDLSQGLKAEYAESKLGVIQYNVTGTVECIFPTITSVPGFNDLMIHVPVDDTHCRMLQIARVTKPGTMAERRISHNGKHWRDCTPEELQKCPGDMEAMKDIPAAAHSWEHLATTDRGVVLMRRIWSREVDKVLRGEDPLGISYDPDEPPRETAAGIRRPQV